MEDLTIPIPAKAWVASDNIISSLGFTTQENIKAMLAGKSGITKLDDPAIYPEPFFAGIIDKKRLNIYRKKHELEEFSELESLIILSISDALSQTSIDLTDEKSLLILSTTKGDIACLSGNFPPEKKAFLWETAQTVADYFHLKNTPLVVSNACVSGVTAVEIAARFLRERLYETIVVVGADSITAFTVSGFQAFKSISPQPCKPFDIHRDGLSIGEGTACMILTNNESFLPDYRRIEILGGAISNDANHISGPSRTGDGLFLSISNAMKYAEVNRQDIDFINLHGTATLYNDEMESKAIRLAGLSEIPTNSLKAYWGHTLGASGIMEIIACIESLKQNQLIASLGFSQLGVPEPMNIISQNTPKEVHTFLKTASGFGGFNSAILISDKKSRLVPPKLKRNTPYEITADCSIKNKTIKVNGSIVFEDLSAENFQEFIKTAFKQLGHPYPKFYKMDALSKLGYVTVQYLFSQEKKLERYNKKKISLLFVNSVSSLDTDIRHQQSIRDKEQYYPSPSVFVYTLPNIVSGEICIKEKIQGETTFFVMEKEDTTLINKYINLLLNTTDTEAVMIGRINCLGEAYESHVSFVEKKDFS